MKVAMLGWEYPPFISGGLGVHCFYLTKTLAEMGVKIDFFMPQSRFKIEPPHPNMRIIPVSRAIIDREGEESVEFGPYAEIIENKAVNQLPGSAVEEPYGYDFIKEVLRFNRMLAQYIIRRNRREKYDLIHGHDWIPSSAGILAAKQLKVPYVLTIHSTEFDRTANLSPFNWIVEMERHALAGADQIIAVSNLTKNELNARYFVSPEKVKVVYNGIDPARFKNGDKVSSIHPNKKIVLFHGRLSVQKGPDLFLKTAARILQKEKNVHFIISGKGPLLPQLINQAIGLGIIDKVTFTGYTEEDRLPQIYSLADVYVLPSVSEPFGLTVLEAMSSGTPVVLSKTAGVSENLSHCLQVDFWDADEMASKIIALLKYSELHGMLSKGGINDSGKFSWQNTAMQTLAIYAEVLKK